MTRCTCADCRAADEDQATKCFNEIREWITRIQKDDALKICVFIGVDKHDAVKIMCLAGDATERYQTIGLLYETSDKILATLDKARLISTVENALNKHEAASIPKGKMQ